MVLQIILLHQQWFLNEMNRESLQKRLGEIEKAIEQSMANLNMLIGGKEECLYWLKQIESFHSNGMPLHELKEILGADSVEVVDAK